MTFIEWVNLLCSIAGLALGYLGAHGQIQRWYRSRKLPKLLKDKLFLEALHESDSLQQAYLLESLMLLGAIAGAGLMLCSLPALPIASTEALGAVRFWLFGGTVYLFALMRLGRYWDAVKRFDKSMARIAEDIERLRR